MLLADECLLSSTQSYNNMDILDSSVQDGGQGNKDIKILFTPWCFQFEFLKVSVLLIIWFDLLFLLLNGIKKMNLSPNMISEELITC